jgi:hypothetical protein
MMTMTHGSLVGAIPCGSTPAEQSALEVSDMDTFSSGRDHAAATNGNGLIRPLL